MGTIKTEESVRDQIRHRARDTTTRDKQPNPSGPVRQRYGEKSTWAEADSEIDKRPTELKPSPILTGRNEQYRSTQGPLTIQHDRHGDRPCY